MSKKRIAVISPSEFPGKTGDSVHFSVMINQLAAEGFKISLICPKIKSSDDKNGGFSSNIEITRIPFHPPRLKEITKKLGPKHYLDLFLFLFAESLTVLWVLATKRIKHVFIRHSILTIQLPVILKLAGTRVVADVAELVSASIKYEFNPNFLWLLKSFEKRTIKLYKCFKVQTNSQAKNLQKFGLPKEQIMVIPVCVKLSGIPRCLLEETPKHSFGYFGGLEKWQGVDLLLQAFKLLLKRMPEAQLYIIGNGSLENSIKQTLARNNLSSNVMMFNSVPSKILWNEYFRKFRIVVIPANPPPSSNLDSNIPMKLVESFAAGKPIIVMDIPAMKEIPKNSVFVVPSPDPESLANSMETLSKNDEKMKEYSKTGISCSTNYDVKNTIKKVIHYLFES